MSIWLTEEELARHGTEIFGNQLAEGLVAETDEPAAVLGADGEAAGDFLAEFGPGGVAEGPCEGAGDPGLQLLLQGCGQDEREVGGFGGAEALRDGGDDLLEKIGIGQLKTLCSY